MQVEAMGAIATTAGISGQMVQDLMLECVEKRFGALNAPHPIEWLSDNSSCYTAKETVTFASMLGLLSRFTPVRSPESNGMAEAFVNYLSSVIICVSTPVPTRQRFWPSFRAGSRTTTRGIPTRGCG
jgi:transposase InsO family protein